MEIYYQAWSVPVSMWSYVACLKYLNAYYANLTLSKANVEGHVGLYPLTTVMVRHSIESQSSNNKVVAAHSIY